ncbi:MAG: response regulator [Planctomycetota bacterium]
MKSKDPIHVLLVEDNPTDVLLAREALSRSPNVALTNVTRLADAISFFTDKTADVGLLDLGLPDSQGLETLVRLLESAPHCPIIVFTGQDDDQLGLQALNLGAQDFLAKSQIVKFDLARTIRYAIERKRIESEKIAAERKLNTLSAAISNAANGVVITDRAGTMIYVNAAFCNMTGYRDDELLGKNPRLLKSNRQDPSTYTELWSTIVKGDVWRGVLCNRRKDGTFYHEEMTVTPVRGQKGAIEQFVAFKSDISKQKHAEDLLKSVVDSTTDGIVSFNEKAQIETFNAAAERQFEYRLADIVGRNVDTLVSLTQRPKHDDFVDALLSSGDGQEVVCHRRDGSTFSADFSVNEFLLDSQRHFTGIVRDITERKTLEQSLRQAQKMEAFGQLAGGVAHDFNNLLTIISGYSEIILPTFMANDPRRQHLKAVHDASERAVGMTRQLLAFSRKSIVEPRVMDLNTVVQETAKMLRRMIGEDVTLTTLLGSQPMSIKADPSQMDQILLNLAVNARDAMPRGGKLTIETAQVELDDEYVRHHLDARPGHYVSLQVSDTGYGMTPEVKARIFEPFFTTKEVGKGTGLGLATVFGIVKQSDGSISVYSEVGMGTTFKILLPAVDDLAASPAEKPVVTGSPGKETILFVEDEENIREFTRHILESNGYVVLTANNGKEAIEIFDASQAAIDLVLTDVVMPEMGGRELVDHLRQKSPGIKVVFTSGFTDDAMIRYGILQSAGTFLQKPFSPNNLVRKVRETLDAPAQAR